VTNSEAWIEERLRAAPAALRRKIEEAIEGEGAGTGDDVAARWQAVAERLLAAAKTGPPTRETAVTLLAADALVTLACEWTAEFEPRRLGELR
jgi:hypothetical protein